jgi:hypothetical protein
MKLRVRFRFNKATGEVETFQIEDQGQSPQQPEHDRRHEAKSAEIARVLERYPQVRELLPGAAPLPEGAEPAPAQPESGTERPGIVRVRGLE